MESAADKMPPGSDSTVLAIGSWEDPFDNDALQRFSTLLPEFVPSRRWYRAKARTIKSIRVQDIISFPGISSYLLVIQIEYADGGSDRYLLPVSLLQRDKASLFAIDAGEVIANVRASDGAEGIVYNALANPTFREALLDAITCENSIEGRTGSLAAFRTTAFHRICGSAPKLESAVSKAEQSNSSIVYGSDFILKLFRKIEPGINPDIEVGTFLTEHGFEHTPAVLGWLEYREAGGDLVYAAGILQQFVPNQGDAWKYTLESLSGFFNQLLNARNSEPAPKASHPMQLMKDEFPPEVHQLIGAYLHSANLLGNRTAEMHTALASGHRNPDFSHESFAPADAQALYDDFLRQANLTFDLLRLKIGTLSGNPAANVKKLLETESRVRDRFSAIRDHSIDAVRIRYHGDFHLGQVLYTGSDFMIIDFEGEPARPLAERRGRTLAMRDVAGMLRSFQYAAYAALFGQVSGVPTNPELKGIIESWASWWTAYVSAAYLKGYFEVAEGKPFVPANPEERRVLLDAFLLHKALYEVAYELNNRPDWMGIPLRGILGLLS